MASQRSSSRRTVRRVGAALAGALALSSCGATSTSESPDATATSAETAGAAYTVEQVRSAVAAVDSKASALELRVTGPEASGVWDATVDPAECTQQLQSGDESRHQHVPTDVVSGVGDESRLRVRAAVFTDAQTAQAAASAQAPTGEGQCREYTVTAKESGVSTQVTDTAYAVELPDGTEEVSAVTRESVTFDPAFRQEARNSQVHAVVENVWVTAEYGAPRQPDGGMDPKSVPLQAEQAAAERAARQVLSHLTGSG
ncbi:hypothetical protein ACT4S5_13115 [Kocuria oceani]|uniref:hypothetical protein n=1 Tax=Kocuria oceani TaxID=988827 RepID=UPI0040371364